MNRETRVQGNEINRPNTHSEAGHLECQGRSDSFQNLLAAINVCRFRRGKLKPGWQSQALQGTHSDMPGPLPASPWPSSSVCQKPSGQKADGTGDSMDTGTAGRAKQRANPETWKSGLGLTDRDFICLEIFKGDLVSGHKSWECEANRKLYLQSQNAGAGDCWRGVAL